MGPIFGGTLPMLKLFTFMPLSADGRASLTAVRICVSNIVRTAWSTVGHSCLRRVLINSSSTGLLSAIACRRPGINPSALKDIPCGPDPITVGFGGGSQATRTVEWLRAGLFICSPSMLIVVITFSVSRRFLRPTGPILVLWVQVKLALPSSSPRQTKSFFTLATGTVNVPRVSKSPSTTTSSTSAKSTESRGMGIESTVSRENTLVASSSISALASSSTLCSLIMSGDRRLMPVTVVTGNF
mmetsp:Transcript_24529/g.57003  ORF Transcript_24529/g.57003 Transcript_24529/m.57003 type:complete len:242 (-) Transcript_24529:1924-2649(-)